MPKRDTIKRPAERLFPCGRERSGTSHPVVELVSFCLTGCLAQWSPVQGTQTAYIAQFDQWQSTSCRPFGQTCFSSLLSSSYSCHLTCRPDPKTAKSLGTVHLSLLNLSVTRSLAIAKRQPPLKKIRTAQYLTPASNRRSKLTQEATVLIQSTRSTHWTTMEGLTEK